MPESVEVAFVGSKLEGEGLQVQFWRNVSSPSGPTQAGAMFPISKYLHANTQPWWKHPSRAKLHHGDAELE